MVIAGVAACSDDDSPTDPEPGPDEVDVLVTGEVTDAGDGEPVEGTEVTVLDAASTLASGTTDADGSYELEFTLEGADLPDQLSLEAQAEGYEDYEATVDFQESITHDIGLASVATEATITGSVVDEDTGDGIGAATVTGEEAATGEELFEATTDAVGDYEASLELGDEPEELLVRAEVEGYVVREREIQFADEMTVDFELPEQLFAGGRGTPEDPYQVETVEQLQSVDERLDAHFVQTADIDASETEQWNDGNGFEPIGHMEWDEHEGIVEDDPFNGTFDGGGHTIEGLAIDRGDEAGVGLFGIINDALLENISVADAFVHGERWVGVLVGAARPGSELQASHASGELSGVEGVGGLVGSTNGSEIHDSSAEGTIVAEAPGMWFGGLLGLGESGTEIRGSHAEGSVEANSSPGVGGVAGSMGGEGSLVDDSYATAEVNGGAQVGGLVGSKFGEIRNAHATGTVSGDGQVGGLVGRAGEATVRNSYAEGQVEAEESAAGGLVGQAGDSFSGSEAEIFASFAEGDVTGSDDAGGLVGRLEEGLVSDSYATGAATADERVGGFVGHSLSDGVISESFSIGEVSGTLSAGGFAGDNQGETADTYWDTEASGTTDGAGAGSDAGMEGLTTSEMTGSDAVDNMDGLDFDETWSAIAGDYPALWWEN